ncbi:MAG: hypothetical protein ACQCN4_13270 [Candidatus Bathyarchaeia archaeon]|jgi:hypothetical protein
MERNEVITCLKELLHADSNLSPQAITFQENKNSLGYMLHIKGIVQQSDREIVETVAKKHNLTVRQE